MAKDPTKMSRPDRWVYHCSNAIEALQALVELQQEYEEWRDNLPENVQDGPTSDKLYEVCDLDIQGALSTVEEAEGMDLPRGFGRD